MLLNNEINVGGLYAWDVIGVGEPRLGCNLFTILEDTQSDFGRLIVESLDGCITFSCGEHCLVTAEKAMKRLNILEALGAPEDDSHAKWSYDRELKYLRLFKSAYDLHTNSECS
jgi:hypothetical protein